MGVLVELGEKRRTGSGSRANRQSDDVLDKEGHGGEGAGEDNAAQWQAGEAALEGWSLVLVSPGEASFTSQAAHTSQSPLFVCEPQAQGGLGEDGFPARKAGTGFKEPAAREKVEIGFDKEASFLLFNCQTPLQLDRFVLCN